MILKIKKVIGEKKNYLILTNSLVIMSLLLLVAVSVCCYCYYFTKQKHLLLYNNISNKTKETGIKSHIHYCFNDIININFFFDIHKMKIDEMS